MKTIAQKATLLVIIILTGCSSGGKFTGKWREVNRGRNSVVFIIEKKGEKYDVYTENKPEAFMPMEYDKDHDMLTAQDGRMTLDAKIDSETKHLKMGPRGDGDTKEFEKIK